jgi:multiple sugar transport system permease protein
MTARTLSSQRPLSEWAYRHREKLLTVVAFAAVAVVVTPAFWLLLSSFKSNEHIFLIPPQVIPNPFTFDNYTEALAESDFQRYLLNSFVVSAVSTVICLLFSVLAAYALTFLRFYGRNIWLGLIVGTQFFPAAILLLPLYRLWAELRLFDTHYALIITYVATALSLCTWLMIGFYRTVPAEVIDAATIDGCGKFSTLWRIILPLSTSGLLACAAFVYIGVWQEFLLAVTLIANPELKTVTVGLYGFITEHRTAWNLLIAASVAISVPTIIIFGLIQRYLVEGIAAGALK